MNCSAAELTGYLKQINFYSIESSFGELNPLRVKEILLATSYSNYRKEACLKSLYSVPAPTVIEYP
jgi:hypothetical protein